MSLLGILVEVGIAEEILKTTKKLKKDHQGYESLTGAKD